MLGAMPAKSRDASTSSSSGLYVRITLADPSGKMLMNALSMIYFLTYN